MLYGKYVSLKNIIAKVYRDLQLTEEEPFIDMIEWGAEALEQIGVFESLSPEEEELEVSFYKTALPTNLVYLDHVYYEGYPVLPSSHSFGPQKITLDDNDAYTGLSVPVREKTNTPVRGSTRNNHLQLTYTIKNGFIRTSFETGKISIAYRGLNTDCEGYPMVPDDVSFREAVYRYIVYKFLYPKYITGQIHQNIYLDAEAKWHWYCGQAGAKAQMPDLGKLEKIKRNYLSLKPDLYRFDTFFESVNAE